MTRIVRSTPPERETAAMPSMPSSRFETVLSMYQLNCSSVMSVVSAPTNMIGWSSASTRVICGSRIPSGRLPRIWAIALRTSFTARSVDVPISNCTKVKLLPSRTELLISSTPFTPRIADSTLWVIWVSISFGAAPGWLTETVAAGKSMSGALFTCIW